MSRSQTCTLMITYDGLLRHISFPENTEYEDFLKLAMEHFQIPIEVFEFIELNSEEDYMFKKDTFENYLILFPEPKITFKLDVNFGLLLDSVQNYANDPLEDLNSGLKRRRQLVIELESDTEPLVKRLKVDFSGPDMMETL